MLQELRKIVTFDEDIYREGGKEAEPILRIIGVAAVLENPWKGKGFVEDLKPEIKRIAPVMGKALTDRLISMVGSREKIEAYGKAAIAGTSCEIEHASAIIHTLQLTLKHILGVVANPRPRYIWLRCKRLCIVEPCCID